MVRSPTTPTPMARGAQNIAAASVRSPRAIRHQTTHNPTLLARRRLPTVADVPFGGTHIRGAGKPADSSENGTSGLGLVLKNMRRLQLRTPALASLAAVISCDTNESKE